MRHRAGRTAGHGLARPRSRRQAAAARPRRCWRWRPKPRMPPAPSRASPTPRAPRRAGAASSMMLAASNGFCRRLSPRRLFAVLRGAGRRRHRHGARLRMVERRPSRRPDGGRPRSAATPASSPSTASIRARRENARVPVVYDRRVSGGLIGHLAGAINGRAVARGTSFLKDRMGEQIFADGIRILDNPHRKRGLGSRPFDAEGLPTRRYAVIDDGVLTTWLLDLPPPASSTSSRPATPRAARRPALAHHLELLSREGQALGRRADRRHQERALHHRPDRLRRQRRHRRLQPRRVGLLDRERQARLAGERHHRGRQPQGHVPQHDRRPTTCSSRARPMRRRCESKG